MTLMEVIVAMTILAGALLALAIFSSRLAAASTAAKLDAIADELASDRLEMAKNKRTYLGVDSLVATENSPSGERGFGFTRQTQVKRVGGAPADSMDYKIVTITVSHYKMLQPTTKSITIAAY
jgi:Tfp pilus assembly protein PilV